LSVNWKKTKRYWEKLYPGKTAEEISAIEHKPVVRELNEDTDGYRMSWYWDKTTYNHANQFAYHLDMARAHDQVLSKGIQFNNLNFYT
jgi:hypothetical protein